MSDINERLAYRNQYGVIDLFGAESSILREGLETEREVNALTAALERCKEIVQIPGDYCLNVSVAGSIVMYDRVAKRGSA